MYKNYHHKQLLYPALEHDMIIEHLKQYEYKHLLLQKVLNTIKPFQEVMLKVTLKDQTIILTIIYDAESITPGAISNIKEQINYQLRYKKNILLTENVNGCHNKKFKLLRGFN